MQKNEAFEEFFQQPPEYWRRSGRNTGMRLKSFAPDCCDEMLEDYVTSTLECWPLLSPDRAEAYKAGFREGYTSLEQ